jgi:hypothetical protein
MNEWKVKVSKKKRVYWHLTTCARKHPSPCTTHQWTGPSQCHGLMVLKALQGTVDPKNHSSSGAKTLQAASVVWENHHTGMALHASWCEKLGVENQQCQLGCSERMWNRRRPWCCTSPRYQQASRKPMRPHLNHSHPWVEKG